MLSLQHQITKSSLIKYIQLLDTFFFQLMGKKQNIAIWIGILGGGAAFFFLYGYLVDIMR